MNYAGVKDGVCDRIVSSMAKKRTRKQKIEAHHSFTISYQSAVSSRPEARESNFEPHVKGQIKNRLGIKISGNGHREMAEESAQGVEIEFIKRDILKSIILVSLILALELVIYLAVHK